MGVDIAGILRNNLFRAAGHGSGFSILDLFEQGLYLLRRYDGFHHEKGYNTQRNAEE
jgi:hypothetical protein